MDAQSADIKAYVFHGSYLSGLGSTLDRVPYPEWYQFLIHLSSLMHLHGRANSVKEKKKSVCSPRLRKWMRSDFIAILPDI